MKIFIVAIATAFAFTGTAFGAITFEELDTSQDGYVDAVEASAIPALSEAFPTLDVDADGKLTIEEFASFEQ